MGAVVATVAAVGRVGHDTSPGETPPSEHHLAASPLPRLGSLQLQLVKEGQEDMVQKVRELALRGSKGQAGVPSQRRARIKGRQQAARQALLCV